ncbi:MAG: hypothetical protein EOO88_01675 [Pedobacter sp.]|nr:MAG: hypothetical protein EOO88_01675 [Pedobacter sp.]
MSFKSISQTRWTIEPDQVRIYPYGLFKIFAVVFGVLMAGLILFYLNLVQGDMTGTIPLFIVFIIIIAIFWGIAATYIEFDNRKGQMRKMSFGFIPTTTLSFTKLQGINVVSNTLGGYVYRLYEKEARYGRGIVVSSRYGKNDDPNAIDFVSDVVPLVHSYLDQHEPLTGVVEPLITDFKYFTQEGSIYTVKNNKAGGIIFGLVFLAIAGSLLTTGTDSPVVTLLIILVLVFVALVFFNAAFTKVTIDTAANMLYRTGPVKFTHRKYALEDYVGVQMLRRSVNFVYSGTDINLYFNVPEKNKQTILTIASMRRSRNIERFMKELYQILDRR